MIHYNDNLYHSGVKGMKWGHRKQKKTPLITRAGRAINRRKANKNKYQSNNKGDIALYGQKGANRIKKRMAEKGMSHKKAERREVGRSIATNIATKAAVAPLALYMASPALAKIMGQKAAATAGTVAGKAASKVIKQTGGYSYKNAAKYVAMNIKNSAKGVTYSTHKATKFLS